MHNESILQIQLKDLEARRIEIQERSGTIVPISIAIPIISGILGLALTQSVVGFLFLVIGSIFGFVLYHATIGSAFQNVKNKFKSALVGEYMKSYHPDMKYSYKTSYEDGRKIIKAKRLMSADIYNEEDVIRGTLGDVDFYLSEMHLQNESENDGQSSKTTIFRGFLFQIKIPNKNFSEARIESNAGIIKKWFSNYKEHPEHGFSFQTDDEQLFYKELEQLFPFIAYLQKTARTLRVHIEGDTISFMLSSDMKFLDDPKPKLAESLLQKKYYQEMVKQLNSLLFIVESFAGELDTLQIEEGLQLRVAEQQKIAMEG